MRRLALLSLLVLAPGCDVRDSLLSVLLTRAVYDGDATAASPPPTQILLLRSAQDEAAARAAFGLPGPFAGIDYRTEVGVLAAREVPTAEGQTAIDRVELRGQRTVAVRAFVAGARGAPTRRLSVAVVAVDRFSDAFTETEADFR